MCLKSSHEKPILMLSMLTAHPHLLPMQVIVFGMHSQYKVTNKAWSNINDAGFYLRFKQLQPKTSLDLCIKLVLQGIEINQLTEKWHEIFSFDMFKILISRYLIQYNSRYRLMII